MLTAFHRAVGTVWKQYHFLPGLSVAKWQHDVLATFVPQARQVMLGRGVKGPNLEEKIIRD